MENQEKHFEDVTGMIVQMASQKASPGSQLYNDMIEAAGQNVERAKQKYDPAKHTKFSTYAHWWIKAAVLKTLKTALKHPVKVNSDISTQEAISESVQELTETKMDISKYLDILDERERDILQMHYGLKPYSEAYSMAAIADELNISGVRVSQIVEGALVKIKAKYAEVTPTKRKEVITMNPGETISLEKLDSVQVVEKNAGTFQRIREAVMKLIPEGQAMKVADVILRVPELQTLKGPKRYNYLQNAIKKDVSIKYLNVNGVAFIGIEKKQ